ncbi:amidase [Enterococcus sp. LJL128]
MKDAVYWVEKFKQKEISLSEYYKELDQQVQKLNPAVNGLVEWDFEAISKEVKDFSIDEQLPFSGMPFPLKMLGQEKAGWKATFGSHLFSDARSKRTSNYVKKLEQLGFIAAGQTNSPEFGFKNITDPVLYGPARNPWNLDYSPGGSSGGAAAVVASGLFPIAGASDGGGSIRIPAAFTGLIGLKPTRGAMPTGPNGWRGWQGAAIDFALTVSMRDTEKLFYGMRGIEKAAPYQPPLAEWQSHTIDRPLKIAYIAESPVGTEVSKDAQQALKQMVNELNQLGHDLTEVVYPVDGVSLIESYYLMNGAETSAMFDGMQQKLQRKLTADDVELITWGLYQYGEQIPVKKYIHALNLWDHAAVKMEELFTQYDLLLTPTTAYSAPEIDQELQSDAQREALRHAEELTEAELKELICEMFEKSLALSPYTQIANMTGQPAISLPTYVTEKGLPLGIQFIASKGREDLLLHMGKQLEKEQLFKLPKVWKNT